MLDLVALKGKIGEVSTNGVNDGPGILICNEMDGTIGYERG